MARYKVVITKTVKKHIYVEAEDCESAERIAKKRIADNKVCLDTKAKMSFTAEYADKEMELEVSHYRMGSTVELMDRFDERIDDKYKYSRLVVNNYMLVDCADRKSVWVSLLIDRISYWDKKTYGDITMTELKRDYCAELHEYIKSNICTKGGKAKSGDQILFEVPYRLRAQRSLDRMPGGWGYGTLYGETSDYGIVGIRLEKE
jgi:hypothetical protein